MLILSNGNSTNWDQLLQIFQVYMLHWTCEIIWILPFIDNEAITERILTIIYLRLFKNVQFMQQDDKVIFYIRAH